MKVLVVYAHPSKNSFTYLVKEQFLKELAAAGHTYEVSDLYAMDFKETFTENEYLREAFYEIERPVPEDVLIEQKKCRDSDAVVFIYPVFWTEAPSKLVSWFQRVWTYGFAYGPEATLTTWEKALFLVTMGGCKKDPVRQQEIEAMKTVMLGDRIHERAKEKEMIIFDEMTRGYGNDGRRAENQEIFLNSLAAIARSL